MTPSEKQIDKVFGSLESAGYPRSLQNMLLPDWVTPEVLSDSTTSTEIAAILAKRLGLRTSPLFSANPRVETLRRRDVKYRRSIPNKSKNLTAATSIAISIAESISYACLVEFQPLTSDPYNLRREVLSHSGYWIGLRNLLMTCWAHGIPVIYLSELGQGVAKMDGMVVNTESRPVIILSKVSPLWSWQLFILAHEVAHIVLGHVRKGEVLIDEELGEGSYFFQDKDAEELDSDRFALQLLNGRDDATYTLSDENANYQELANTAYQYGKANQIDPGHIALNFANNTGKWSIGIAAAQVLQGNNPSASAVINQAMWGGIDTDSLPVDTVEFIAKLTG